MDQIPGISEAVYVGMCCIVGTPTIVSIRRDVEDIKEIIKRQMKQQWLRSAISGSHREGFILLASDIDFMDWLTDHHVIWDLNHAEKYNTERCTLILMECSEERPGFVMLKLLTPSNIAYVRKSCIRIFDEIYISSTKYRLNTLCLVMNCSIQHGPCASGRFNNLEFDIVHCFACKFWPSIASRFIKRCFIRRWPPNYIVGDIVNSGCHIVPIGFKGSPQEDFEWRISFSLAEQKLVYCMNHTQFVCYGLLKLFLKEVLSVKDTNGEPLLCSYFMKTVLFWVIQNNTLIDWNPSSLLSGFWMCFKFLLSCVYHGVLPNFFIPENNMFIRKIVGYSQQLLYERLLEMYNIGIACLLHCHSIIGHLTDVICENQIILNTSESKIIFQFNLDGRLLREFEIDSFEQIYYNTEDCLTTLNSVIRCIHARNISPWQLVALRKLISLILRCFAYHIYDISNNLYNKRRLRVMNACFNLLKVGVKMGCISDRIYLAFFLHAIGKNNDAIKNLLIIKTSILQPYIVYGDLVVINGDNVDISGDSENGSVDDTDNESLNDVKSYTVDKNGNAVYLQRYIEEVGKRAPSQKMRRAVAKDILIDIPVVVIKELELEYSVTLRPFMSVPPYVMTLMLLVLCYRHGGNQRKQNESLSELFIIVNYDEGRFIPTQLRDISWQILGICQQICGNHQEALLSYQNSLLQFPFNDIQRATYQRIKDAQTRI